MVTRVKAILDTQVDDAIVRQRFAREARASARIVHPNVVGVFDLGEFEGGAYLVLEFLAPNALTEIDRTLRIADNVIRHKFIRLPLGEAHRRGLAAATA